MVDLVPELWSGKEGRQVNDTPGFTQPQTIIPRQTTPSLRHPTIHTHTNFIILIKNMDQSATATATATMGNQPIDESLYSRQLSVLLSFLQPFLPSLPPAVLLPLFRSPFVSTGMDASLSICPFC